MTRSAFSFVSISQFSVIQNFSFASLRNKGLNSIKRQQNRLDLFHFLHLAETGNAKILHYFFIDIC
jgi:hypothetical protein